MKSLAELNVATPDFKCSAQVEGRTLVFTMLGTADLRAKDALENALRGLHAEAQRLHVKEVTVDVKQLEFMNSSCFKNFVTWIGRVTDLEPELRYPIRFTSNPSVHWQRRSLQALRSFSTDLVLVD